jgi:predicted RNA-binding Zn ribbon-like protein
MSNDETVPPAVRLVRDFVNTYEPQIHDESLDTPDALRKWLADEHLLRPGSKIRSSDLATAVAFREGLREVLLGHAGHAMDPAAMRGLDDVLAAVPVRLSLADGTPRLLPAGDTRFDQALGGLVEAIRQCAEQHVWIRLKACARDTCRWAYYDASRNQNRRWCSMAGCGNYVKNRRAYAVRRGRGGSAVTDARES